MLDPILEDEARGKIRLAWRANYTPKGGIALTRDESTVRSYGVHPRVPSRVAGFLPGGFNE